MQENKTDKKEIVVESFSKDTLGIKDKDGWFNIKNGNREAVKPLIEQLTKGSLVELELSPGKSNEYTNLVIKKVGEKKGWADEITTLEILLEQAHKKGLISITTEVITIDLEKKYALFKAEVRGYMDKKRDDVGTFHGHGDVTDENIGSDAVKKHWIRFAESRAICRSLRWYVGEHKVAKEELGGDEKK